MARRTRSFEPNASKSVTLPGGQIAHELHVEQSRRLARSFSEVRPGVWCFVGNGLSNQSFIDAPEGIIAIDTGESIEEMNEAIAELRKVSTRPIVAVMYTHFHYVDGTKAVVAENGGKSVPIWGHEKIAENRRRTASEIAPAYGRGLVEQFAMQLPEDGEDGRVNVGLGHFYRNPKHAPFTPGFIEPTHTFGATANQSMLLD
jgi:alkyl sulfatase BDS1-like metallo-beta-lactamase superfamily hydrolase